jgi:hypothetical protein
MQEEQMLLSIMYKPLVLPENCQLLIAQITTEI